MPQTKRSKQEQTLPDKIGHILQIIVYYGGAIIGALMLQTTIVHLLGSMLLKTSELELYYIAMFSVASVATHYLTSRMVYNSYKESLWWLPGVTIHSPQPVLLGLYTTVLCAITARMAWMFFFYHSRLTGYQLIHELSLIFVPLIFHRITVCNHFPPARSPFWVLSRASHPYWKCIVFD